MGNVLRKNAGRVAVICAYNHRNCGMYSVDLAANYFMTSLGVDFTLFIAHQKKEREGRPWGRLRYEKLVDLRQLDNYDLIVFWGDFINNPAYGYEDFPNRELAWGLVASREQAYEKWKNIFLLKGYEKRQRVISVSNNFQNILPFLRSVDASARDAILDAYRTSFDHIFPRDGSSFRNMLIAAPELEGKVVQGVDAAFLLNQSEIYPSLGDVSESNTFAYYFSRSKLSNVHYMLFRLWRRTGFRPVNVRNWLKMDISNPDQTYSSALARIKAAKFVVSDTYHCLINSMNLGKKVIGVGRSANVQEGTCGDFKKKVLFDDFGLSNFYIETDLSQNRLTESLLDSIGDLGDFSWGVLAQRRSEYKTALTDAILGAL